LRQLNPKPIGIRPLEEMSLEEIALDSIVLSVIQKFRERAMFGKKKYGTDLDRKDLEVKDWIQHAQEELMDGILYLEKLKCEIRHRDPSPLPSPTTVADPQQPQQPNFDQMPHQNIG
jgi:hypothetical protein